MNCAKCKKEATITTPFGERKYCDKHFMEFIEKRIRKDLRVEQRLDIKKKYYLEKNNSTEYIITKYFLNNIFNGRLKLSTKKENVIFPKTLDEETDEFLELFLKNAIQKKIKTINPLRTILESELKEICRIKKIEYKPKKHNEILAKLEATYPGTKFSVNKSKNFINKKIKKI